MQAPSSCWTRLCRRWAPLVAALCLAQALQLRTSPEPALLRARSVDPERAPWYLVATLPGMGPPLARRIVWYRRLIAALRTAEDLHRVPGVGLRRLDSWSPWIRSPGTP